MFAEPAGHHNFLAVRDHRGVRRIRAGALRRRGQRLRRGWAESRARRREPHRGRGARVVRLVRPAILVLIIGSLVGALVFHSWVSAQTRAVIVLSRTSNTPVVSWLVGVVTDEPRVEDTIIAGQPTMVVRPGAGRSWRAVVFVNGVTRRGRHQPDVERLARALARAGYLVAVPDPPGLREGTLTLRTLGATTAVARAVAERPDVRGGRVGLFGVSVGASLALLAAEQPSLAGRIRVVAGLAPYTDLVHVVRLTTTTVYVKHGRSEPYRTKPFATLVVARSLAAALTPGHDRTLLLARLLAVLDDAPDPLAPLRTLHEAGLRPPARALVRLLVNRDPGRFDSLYAALPQRIRVAATLLSPIRGAARLQARVLIASAPHDKYFPPDETRALAHRAPHVTLTVTPTLQHAIPRFSLGDLAGLFRFDAFLVRVLRLAG
jgi:pimeloyl-ACP methyl ester carboxylesterase